ncbi:MAG: beta-ketoacyl synthase N-terminal-like domain-containing protein, partial [Planctomycetia bacterium]
MVASSRRAVITGTGALSPLGNDAATLHASLLQGQSGVKKITNFDISALPIQIAGEIPGFDAKNYVDK